MTATERLFVIDALPRFSLLEEEKKTVREKHSGAKPPALVERAGQRSAVFLMRAGRLCRSRQMEKCITRASIFRKKTDMPW